MIKRAAITLFCVLAMSCCVYAEDGYIVAMKHKSGLRAFSAAAYENMEYVAEDLYTTDKETAEKLLESGEAEFIEPDYPLEAYDAEPNDRYYSQQSYYSKMNIPAIQKLYSGKVRVGIIDSGINKDHPDLVGANFDEGYNYVDNNTDTSDTYNHGTRVASVIAARPDNEIGVAGIAPDCTIVPFVTMMTKNLDGVDTVVGNISNLVSAINGAVNDYDCKVLNISLGSSDYSKSLERAVNNAANKGVIIVAAAGNGGTSEEGIYNYPAAFDNVISVGAVDETFSLTRYSQRNDKIDISAVYSYSYLPNNTGSYSYGAGTSFAAPVITGIVALEVSDNPNFDVYDMKTLLIAAAADVCESGKDYSGYGVPMCDEIENVRNYSHDVFISPYIEQSSAIDLKLMSNSADRECVLIRSSFKDGKLSVFDITPLTFDSNGMAWASFDTSDDEEQRFFVWDSLNGQRSLSVVRVSAKR